MKFENNSSSSLRIMVVVVVILGVCYFAMDIVGSPIFSATNIFLCDMCARSCDWCPSHQILCNEWPSAPNLNPLHKEKITFYFLDNFFYIIIIKNL